MTTADDNKIFQEIDVLDIVGEIGNRNKVLNAKTLQELEKYVNKDSPAFVQLRKFILDEQNSYTRSIVRLIFGDIEYSNFSNR